MSDYNPFEIETGQQSEAERQRRAQTAARSEIDDLKWLMASKRGRRIVHRLLTRTGVFRSSFTGNSETFFREGERNIGLWLMALVMAHAADEYASLISENAERANAT